MLISQFDEVLFAGARGFIGRKEGSPCFPNLQ
jgi:hypothetical protein